MSESLFDISVGLHRLMCQRSDLEEELLIACTVDDQLRIGRALEALEAQIRDEVKPNSQAKVDRCRAYDLHAEMMENAAAAEEKKQAANRQMWKNRRELLKRISMITMEEIGKDRLEGKLGCIRAQVNGGKVALLIPQPELLPSEYCQWEGTWSANVWETMKTYRFDKLPGINMKRIPDTDAIRAALESGEGVPGASLAPRGKHCRIE